MESIVLLLQQHLFLDKCWRLHNTGSRCRMNRPAGDGFFTACLVNGKLSTPELEVRRVHFCNQVHVQRQVETPKVKPPGDFILKHLTGRTHRCGKQLARETMRPCVRRLRVHVQLGFVASRRPSLLSVNNNMENLRVSLDKKGKLTGPHV